MNTVFVPQETKRRDSETGNLVPVHDFSQALAYGRLVDLLPSFLFKASDGRMYDVIDRLVDGLAQFDDEDYIIATGDPAILGATVLIAGTLNQGRVKLLRWDRLAKEYRAIQIDVRKHTGVQKWQGPNCVK